MLVTLIIVGALLGGLVIGNLTDDDGDDASEESGRDLTGTEGDDMLGGGPNGDLLDALGGDDEVMGFLGDDTIDGGSGDDRLLGGEGQDQIDGGAGDDTVFAGAGDDAAVGRAGADSIRGGDGADILDGGAGDDTVAGDDGDDLLSGGAGMDTVRGGAGDDILNGIDVDLETDQPTEQVRDRLVGEDGDDLLILGARDQGFGGDGADVFSISSEIGVGEAVSIEDFDPAEDRLDVILAAGEPQPEVATADNGGSTDVFLDGVRVASVRGVTGLDPSTITFSRF